MDCSTVPNPPFDLEVLEEEDTEQYSVCLFVFLMFGVTDELEKCIATKLQKQALASPIMVECVRLGLV